MDTRPFIMFTTLNCSKAPSLATKLVAQGCALPRTSKVRLQEHRTYRGYRTRKTSPGNISCTWNFPQLRRG